MPAALTVDGLSVDFDGFKAVNGVTMIVDEGELRVLLGANGAGKTTTLKALSNLLPAERGAVIKGEIHFAGLNVKRTKPADLVRHGLVQVLEGRHCFRSLSVEENLITLCDACHSKIHLRNSETPRIKRGHR